MFEKKRWIKLLKQNARSSSNSENCDAAAFLFLFCRHIWKDKHCLAKIPAWFDRFFKTSNLFANELQMKNVSMIVVFFMQFNLLLFFSRIYCTKYNWICWKLWQEVWFWAFSSCMVIVCLFSQLTAKQKDFSPTCFESLPSQKQQVSVFFETNKKTVEWFFDGETKQHSRKSKNIVRPTLNTNTNGTQLLSCFYSKSSLHEPLLTTLRVPSFGTLCL